MPFDGLVLAAVRRELETELVGSRIQRVRQPEKLALVLQLRAPGRSQHLLLSAHPQQARVHLTTERPENPLNPPLFCSVCRKHLEGGRVEAVTQPGFERILRIAVTVRDELGQTGQRILIIEIMGRHSNIILVDETTGNILDAAKRYDRTVSRFREVLPGLPYLTPPREKTDPAGLTVESFGELLLTMPLDLPVWKALQQRLEGLSPLMAREAVYRAGIEPDLALEFCGQHELVLLWEAAQRFFEGAARGQFEPAMILKDDGTPADFAAFQATHSTARGGGSLALGGDCKLQIAGGMNALVDQFFRLRSRNEQVENIRNGLMSIIRQVRKRLEKRLDTCHRAAADGQKAEEMKVFGEILTANLYRLQENTDRVQLENFYTGEAVEIILDPRLTPAHNAQLYFKRYHKFRKGAEYARTELVDLEAEALYLETLETAITLAETPADLQEVREELAGAGYLREKPGTKRPQPQRRKPQQPRRRRQQAEARPLELKTADGTTVYIGRNNRQNDLATFRIGRPDDLWLHTREIPGAHLIIRTTAGQPVSDQTLEEAAAWAAYFSKARHGEKVPVDYTLRKHVHKPRGSRPGFVTYTAEKTILVDPRPPADR
jgi:predicted ribosome quality control (RQC) complex YloA/Tae2 family protein